MKKFVSVVLAVMLLMVSVSAIAEPAVLSVRGTGVVSIIADQASVVIGVRESAEDVLEAQTTVNGKINAICDALLAAGLEQKNLGTASMYIYANYDYSGEGERIVGYTASSSVSVMSDDIDKIGEYIDIAFANGANTLDSVNFSAKESEQAQQEALALAVQNAMEKAQTIAGAAGMEVTSIVSVTESNDYYYDVALGAKYSNARVESAAMDTGTSLQASSLQVTATVLVEFEMSKGD